MPNQAPTGDYQSRQYPEDEISLVDIVLVLYRHKWLMLGSLLVCVVAAATYSLGKPRTYEYVTALSIGVADDKMPIESPEMVKSRLEYIYIPMVQRAIAAERNVEPDRVAYNVDISLPKNTGFVVISTKSPESDAAEAKKMLNNLVTMVIEAHSKAIEQRTIMLKQQIADIERRLALHASMVAADENIAFQKMSGMEDELAALKNRLLQIRDSSQQFEPTRSVKSVGTSKVLIVLLGGLVGLFLGVFGALIAEFSVKFRRELAAQAVAG
jgi:LPS O-antigen subunit length determinant protein (WzzB/FepE family)